MLMETSRPMIAEVRLAVCNTQRARRVSVRHLWDARDDTQKSGVPQQDKFHRLATSEEADGWLELKLVACRYVMIDVCIRKAVSLGQRSLMMDSPGAKANLRKVEMEFAAKVPVSHDSLESTTALWPARGRDSRTGTKCIKLSPKVTHSP